MHLGGNGKHESRGGHLKTEEQGPVGEERPAQKQADDRDDQDHRRADGHMLQVHGAPFGSEPYRFEYD